MPKEERHRRVQGVDFTSLIYAKVLEKPGITKNKLPAELASGRTIIYNKIREMIDGGILIHKNHGLYINPDHIPSTTDIRKRRENLQNFLKGYRQTVSNVLPIIEKKAKKSGKPIFYSESAADVIGIDGMTGKPFTGEIQRINEKCKDDLLLIMHSVNIVIRASYSLYLSQISSLEESGIQVSVKEIEKEQKEALNEIKKTKRTLLKMTAKKGNLGGPVVFQMWWFQLTAGLQMQEDNLVWFEE